MSNTLESSGNYIPKDLRITSQPDSVDKDKFRVTANGLKIDSAYFFQFQYVYPDGTTSEWSPGRTVLTPNIATLAKPKFNSANLGYFQGILKVIWDGTDFNGNPYSATSGFAKIRVWLRDNTALPLVYRIAGDLTAAGVLSIAVPPVSHSVKLTAVSVDGTESEYSDEITLTPVVSPPALPTNVIGAWENGDFAVTFTHNPSDLVNQYLKEYIVTLNGAFKTVSFTLPPVTGSTQRFSITASQIGIAFVNEEVSFTGNVKTIDTFNKAGTEVPILASGGGSTISYVSTLSAPTITLIDPVANGYNVYYSAYTSQDFKEIEIHEVESSSTTDPVTGYASVQRGTSNPIFVPSGTGKRWVKARAISKKGTPTSFSAPQQVTPIDLIAEGVDSTPPSTAVINSASWAGDDVVILATVASDAKKFIIQLTNGVKTSFFTKFPGSSSTSQTVTITQDDLYQAFGEHLKSFAGLFISADSLDNRDSGAIFNIATKLNPISSITPTFTLTGITNGYTVTWSLPSAASYAKVYESGTSWGAGNPTESDLAFSGQSPAIIKKTVYTTRYVKIKYLTVDGFESGWSAEDSVTPIDAIAADTTAPNAPTAGLTATAGIDNSGTLGFNGYVDLSWSAISDSSLRGYRIRFRPYKATAPFENYSYVDSPGIGTSYRLGGLSVGATYEIAIASYDEFNNTSSTYTSYSNQTISGTPALSNYITSGTAGFQFGSGIKDKTGTQNASAQGIYLSNSNYWYLTGSNAAQFKVGGSSANFLEWNGTLLNVDGNITAKGGSFSGNIELKTSGASIWNGPLNSGGSLAGDGFVLNNNGLSIRKGSVNLRLDTADGGIYAEYGQIAGWTIDSAKIERLTNSKYTGISSSGNYAFYAGATASGNSAGDTSASFWVKPDGSAKASDITITGGSLTVGASSIAASTGKLISTDAEITGKITASTGQIGNLKIDSGSLYTGTSPLVSSVTFNSGGIAAYNSSGTKLFGLDTSGFLEANSASIGGWSVNTNSISKINNYVLSGNSVSSTATLSSSTNEIKVSGTGVNNVFEAGIGLPSATESKVLWAGVSKANPAFYVTRDGTVNITGSVVISGYATTGQLDSKANTSMNNVTSVSGGLINTGAIQSNNYVAPTTGVGGTSPFSSDGTRFDITNGSIISKNFVIAADGSARFKGILSSGISIDSPVIIGGELKIGDLGSGNYNFTVNTAGVLEAKSAIINGTIRATAGYIGGTVSGWLIGSGSISNTSTYIDWTGSTRSLTTTLQSNAQITLASTAAPNAAISDLGFADTTLSVMNANSKTVLGGGQFEIASRVGLFSIMPTQLLGWVSAGGSEINLKWQGGRTVVATRTGSGTAGSFTMTVDTTSGLSNGMYVGGSGIAVGTTIGISNSTTLTLSFPLTQSFSGEQISFSSTEVSPARIRWWNYISGNGQRTANLWSPSVGSENFRPIMVGTDGYQSLGPYFRYGSQSSATITASTAGSDGDFWFSTNNA